jgi:hypothetical protein
MVMAQLFGYFSMSGAPASFALVRAAVLDTLDGLDALADAGAIADEGTTHLLRVARVLVSAAASVRQVPVTRSTGMLLAVKMSLLQFKAHLKTLNGSEQKEEAKIIEENHPDMDMEDEEPRQDLSELNSIVDILDRCCLYLAGSRLGLGAQVGVVECLSAGFRRIAICRTLLLPTVHKSWPAVMSRMRELTVRISYGTDADCRSESLLVVALLRLCSDLVVLCGDFMVLWILISFLLLLTCMNTGA